MMKSIRKLWSCLLIFFFFLALFIENATIYKIGFLTANLESKNFEDLNDVRHLFDFIGDNKNHNLKMIEKSSLNIKLLPFEDNLDAILISIQEGKDEEKLNSFKNLLKSSTWRCPNAVTKPGIVKPTSLEIVKTIAYVCYNTSKFKDNYIVDKVFSLLTKDMIGYCLIPSSNDDKKDYCFLGGHFDVKINDSAIRLQEKIEKISSLNKGKNFVTYIAGDVNVRSILKDSTLETIITKPIGETSQEKIDGDNLVVKVYENYFNNSKKKSNYKLNFLSSENIRKLPYTYKYLKGYQQGLKYDIEKIHEKKSLDDTDVKVHNIGWLDRLICVSPTSIQQQCNNSITYFGVPFLKYGDHLPVIGYFEIEF